MVTPPSNSSPRCELVELADATWAMKQMTPRIVVPYKGTNVLPDSVWTSRAKETMCYVTLLKLSRVRGQDELCGCSQWRHGLGQKKSV